MNPDDIIVFPRGVEHDIFDISISGTEVKREFGWEDKMVIIYTRGFDPEYDPMTFMGVLPSLCNKIPELRVMMFGTGELEQDCREFVDSHGLEEEVRILGRVPRTHLPGYYAAADIFVSCALTDGTAVALLEAMAMGLPVVITEIPAIMEWIRHGHNGFLFPIGNGDKLHSCLEILASDEELRKRFSQRNRKIALERADWHSNYEKLEKAFIDLTSG